ncbi:MAG: polyketide synthase dehydratase domain-containing protein, partial [Actinomycetota bacterium]|nr:polyketide synthase dehydratase domain-containing protein [Actinomycetota bacterium]
LATVRFGAAVESAVAAGIDQYLEIGPQPTLLGMIARIRGQETGMHPSLRPGRGDRSEREQILDAVGSLWAAGVEPNWRAIDGEGLAKVPAPTYPFQRQHYWIDTTPRRGRPTGGHPLLGPGSRVPSLRATVHEVDVSAGSPAWLDDHRLAGTLVMPGSAFAEMALAAAGADGNVLELLTIREPLVLADDGAATVQTVVSDQPGGGRDVDVLSWPAGGDAAASRTHAHATVRSAASREAALADVDVDALIGGFPEEVDVAGYYRQLAEVGLTYGPTFHGLERLLRRDGAALGLITLPAGVADRTRYQLHPALLDACFHVLGVAVTADLSGIADGMFVPVAIRGLEVHRSGVTSVWCVGTIIGEPDATSSTIEARLELFAADGALVATIDTLEARKVSAAMWQRALGTARRPLYELEWQPRPRAEAATPARSWVILGDDHGVAEAIAAQLIERSATCRVLPAY